MPAIINIFLFDNIIQFHFMDTLYIEEDLGKILKESDFWVPPHI